MNFFMRIAAWLLCLTLVACGGGGGNPGGSNGGPSGGATVATLEVSASDATLSPTSSTGVTITVVAKDAANNALASQPITFSTSSGVLSSASPTTGSDGRATAVLTAGTDGSSRDITVTAKSGSITKTVVVKVVPTASSVASIEVLRSAPSLLPTDLAGVTVTAVVKDASNKALPDQAIVFSASSGILSAVATKTDADGKATAVLTAGSDATPRDITVTVKSGNVTGSVIVAVTQSVSTVARVEVGASAVSLRSADANGVTISAVVKNASNNVQTGEPVSFVASSGVLSNVSSKTGADGRATAVLIAGADRSNRNITITVKAGSSEGKIVVPVEGTTLSVAGPASLLSGKSATFAVNLKDSSGNGIAAQTIAASSALGNTVTLTQSTTDSSGVTAFTYVASRSGADTVTVTGGGTSQNLAVNVSAIDFAFTAPASGSEATVNVAKTVTVRYLENGAGVAGKQVSFSTTRGGVAPAAATTNAEGYATTQVTSPSAGPGSVSAQLDGVITTLPLNFVATVPQNISLQASAAALSPNTAGGVANQVQLRATVRDAAGNAVKGVTVNFTAVKDLSGGHIKTGTAVTDANGLATDSFIAGAASTAANGVEIRAAVANTAIAASTLLTVSGQSLFINIAANNTIEKLSTTYRKTFSVQVNDANGAPVSGQNVTLSYYPPVYRKGWMKYDAGAKMWVVVQSTQCQNEDEDRNGQLGYKSTGESEDYNGNGRLTPGLPGLIAPPFVITNSAGWAEFTLEYGQQYAYWVDFDLAAKVVVSGTESGTGFLYPAVALASDLTSDTVTPASYISPFGTATDCRDPN